MIDDNDSSIAAPGARLAPPGHLNLMGPTGNLVFFYKLSLLSMQVAEVWEEHHGALVYTIEKKSWGPKLVKLLSTGPAHHGDVHLSGLTSGRPQSVTLPILLVEGPYTPVRQPVECEMYRAQKAGAQYTGALMKSHVLVPFIG
jgi:hypothetical protein